MPGANRYPVPVEDAGHVVRMYIADMEYHYYETRLTRDMQEEGFAATMASLALTDLQQYEYSSH